MHQGMLGFQDVSAALDAGYRPSSAGCQATGEDAVGLRYENAALMGVIPGAVPRDGFDAHLNRTTPEILLYEPQRDGSLQLVGVEFRVYRSAWDPSLYDESPWLDQPFEERFGARARGEADHYALFVWLYRYNPLGLFAPWNPEIRCP